MLASIKQELYDVYKYRYVVLSYVQTNLKLRYRRSILGFLWTVLAPLLNYLVMGIVFSFILHNRVDNYFTYYFSGAIFFSIVSGALNRAPTFIIANEHYIRKIYVPKLIFILNGTTYEVVNFSLSAIALIALGLVTQNLHLSYHIIMILFPLALLYLFLIGLGTIISIGSVYFRDLIHIVPVIVQATFFLTPIAYQENMIPEKYQIFIRLNPFYYFLEAYRQPLVFHTLPSIKLYMAITLISMSTLAIGLVVIKKFDNKIVFKL